jgi:hypothetical protein
MWTAASSKWPWRFYARGREAILSNPRHKSDVHRHRRRNLRLRRVIHRNYAVSRHRQQVTDRPTRELLRMVVIPVVVRFGSAADERTVFPVEEVVSLRGFPPSTPGYGRRVRTGRPRGVPSRGQESLLTGLSVPSVETPGMQNTQWISGRRGRLSGTSTRIQLNQRRSRPSRRIGEAVTAA